MSSNPLAQNALGWARRFSPRQLIVAAVLAAIVIGGSIGLVSWLTAPTYSVLYSGLSAADAGPVTAKLDSDGVPYKLENGGSTVLVPQEQVDTTRIAMAAAKLPAESVIGCEVMDKQSITTDSFTQKVTYQRCLEGEITRTLTAIEGVRSATVRLVMPEERLFTDQETPATAAVVLNSNRALTDENIATVSWLVARSVKNLDPNNITISDSNGRLLSGGDGPTGAGATGTQRKAQAAYERALEEQATTLLVPVVGAGKAVVRVNATMDFTQRSRATEEYDPKKSAAKELSSTKEQYNTTTKQPGGTLTSNPAAGTNELTTTEQNYSKSSDAQALNNTKTITQEVEAPGAVQRLTVSVLMDNKSSGSLSTQQVQALVSNAIGVNTQRGDTVVVDTAPFDTSGTAQAEAAAKALAKERAAAQKQKLYIAGGIGAVLLLAVIGLLVMGLRSRKKTIDPEVVAAATRAAAVQVPVPDLPTVPESTARLPLSVPDRDNEAAAVLASVEQRPEDAARVLRGLMAEDSVQAGGRQ